MRLILASASPRRSELMQGLGIPFDVMPSNVPEIPMPGETPEDFAQRAAREKAVEVGRRCPGRYVLAADTVVALNGAIFGKPVDRADARRMLCALSGKTHVVLTAVTLLVPEERAYDLPGACRTWNNEATRRGAVPPNRRRPQVLVRSEVEFRQLAQAEIEAYLDSGEPFDKAGAYAVQGLAGRFVRAVRGSYSNVVGLPVDEVAALLRAHFPQRDGATA